MASTAGLSVNSLNGRKTIKPEDLADMAVTLKPACVCALVDEAPAHATRKRQGKARERTLCWLDKYQERMKVLEEQGAVFKPLLFGATTGGVDVELRMEGLKELLKRDMDGVMIAGLSMGESIQERSKVLDAVVPELPEHLPRVLCGVDGPAEVLAAVSSGIDLIASAFPYDVTKLGHALVFTWGAEGESKGSERGGKRRKLEGGASEPIEAESKPCQSYTMNLWDRRWRKDIRPLVEGCGCLSCRDHTRAYIHHLLQAHEMLAEVLLYIHNLHHYLEFFKAIRRAIEEDKFQELAANFQVRSND